MITIPLRSDNSSTFCLGMKLVSLVLYVITVTEENINKEIN